MTTDAVPPADATVTDPTAGLPAVADRVGLRLACCGPRLHPSHVEESGPGRLIVSAPARHPRSQNASLPAVAVAAADDEVVVVVGFRRGFEWMELPTTLAADPIGAEDLWELAVAAPPAPAERRAFTRIEGHGAVNLRASATASGAGGATGRLLDLSEGGMRCVIQSTGVLGVGEEIHVRFPVESDVVDATALVVRADRYDAATLEVGLEFRSLPQPGTDRIRHHVSARSAS